MMLNHNFLEEISKTLKAKGKMFQGASCVTQIFPEDGALMQQMLVTDSLSVGSILEPDKDEPLRNVWLLIPVTSSYGRSAIPANFSTIQQYLEEFIVCSKACFTSLSR